MLPTYRAILRDGTLEWGEDGPPPLPKGAVPVHVTVLAPTARTPDGPAMSAALGGPTEFGEPTEAK